MGTDSIKLFNKTLADKILAMKRGSLTHFLEENLNNLRQKEFVLNPIMYEFDKNGGSITDALETLLTGEYTFESLKSDLVQDFALGDEEIYLDYWGCYSAIFNGHPEGSISSLDYLPEQEEETFLLLRPDHVDQMIKSLYNHMDDLSVMDKEQIGKVERSRDFCFSNPNYMVAYLFDF
ncbi:MAG TPA: hypothetical protein VF543_19160 [Pyrinomonadaceae bacterium]|jgi:hypothetical protein